MMTDALRAVALASVSISLLFAGAGGASARTDLVLAIGGEPDDGFDPLLGWGGYGNPLFQSTLLKRDADLETVPDLATRWQLSDDRQVWTLTLREDARFSDGTPLTAEDVAFTFATAKTAGGAVDMSMMESARALDERTVEIRLERPWITFADRFYTLGIVPSAGYGPDYARNPVGSGPYRLVSWTEGEQLIVARNDDYHGALPAFERITFLFTGPEAGLAAASSGVAHMVAIPAQMADSVPQGFRAEAVRTVDNRGISLPFPEPHEVDGRRIGNSVTADPAIRRAMNLGIDRDLVVEVALYGHGTPGFGPADGLPWTGGNDRVDYDLEAARAVLDEAGWVPGGDGVRVKEGLRAAFPINYPASDLTRQALAETAAELLRPLGIEATPRGGSWDSIQRVMHSEPVTFGFGSHTPYQLYTIYSQDVAGTNYRNPSYYANPEVEALFAEALAAQTLEESFPHWSEAADHYGLQGDNSWLWLVNLDHVYLVDDCLDLGAVQIQPHGHGWPITALIENWTWSCG